LLGTATLAAAGRLCRGYNELRPRFQKDRHQVFQDFLYFT
jgi:hypothetical protein